MGTDAKPQAKSRILDVVHETASDLQRFGFMGKRKQQKLRLQQRVRPGLARASEARQTVLVSVLNTSASTVRK